MNDLFTTTDSASEPPAYRWSGRRLVPTAEPGGLAQLVEDGGALVGGPDRSVRVAGSIGGIELGVEFDETPPKRHARLVVEHGFRGCGNESGPVAVRSRAEIS